MLAWFLLNFLILLIITQQFASRPIVHRNETIIEIVANNSNNAAHNSSQKLIDTSIFITLKENDWRDAHEGRMIIWSHESQHHPDYGRAYTGKRVNYDQRYTKSSQLMSFCILGSVIGFILYTYFSHVLMVRKLNREMEAMKLRELVHRSALIMAGSAQQNEFEISERRRSLINIFRSFKL
ncbi:unnamed protein product [Caenorhabditis bovis]|uniref:Uncharacterized protein n=1 Tax=Caenorhabditis bovis TaxID=2654633 RepID=A0A8S1ENZ1_9PELO|nr:unnamed protein product [Caenorhabditis bovis]